MVFNQLPNNYQSFFEPSWTRWDCINTTDKINKYSMDRMIIYHDGFNWKSMRDQYGWEAGSPLGGNLNDNNSWHIAAIIVYHYPNSDKYKIDQLYSNHSKTPPLKKKNKNNNDKNKNKKKRGGNMNRNRNRNRNDDQISIGTIPSFDLDAQF